MTMELQRDINVDASEKNIKTIEKFRCGNEENIGGDINPRLEGYSM